MISHDTLVCCLLTMTGTYIGMAIGKWLSRLMGWADGDAMDARAVVAEISREALAVHEARLVGDAALQ